MPRLTAHEVILEILRKNDGEWTGKTKLFKAFYFAHLYYANANPNILTDWPIARMPEGPGIDNAEKIFKKLTDDGLLKIEIIHEEGPYPEYRYRLTEAGQKPSPIPADAQEAISLATEYCKDKTAAELSRMTHEKSRSWNKGSNGDILDIYIDIIPEDDFQRRQQEIERLDRLLAPPIEF